MYKTETYIADTLASLPTPSTPGVYGYALDTQIAYIYKASGWAEISSGGTGGFVGFTGYDNDNGTDDQDVSDAGDIGFALTYITPNQESVDTDGYHSTSSNTTRITIPSGKSGSYIVSASIKQTGGAIDTSATFVSIRRFNSGGTLQEVLGSQHFGRDTNTSTGQSGTICGQSNNASVGDYFQVGMFANYGGSGDTGQVWALTFCAWRVGEF